MDVSILLEMAANGHRDLFTEFMWKFKEHALLPTLEAWRLADDLPPEWTPYKQVMAADAGDGDE